VKHGWKKMSGKKLRRGYLSSHKYMHIEKIGGFILGCSESSDFEEKTQKI